MELEFETLVFEWRGPAPFFFAQVPPGECEEIRKISRLLSYGWGVIPCSVTVGNNTTATSLFPKQGIYLVPLKDALRKPEKIKIGDTVLVRLKFEV